MTCNEVISPFMLSHSTTTLAAPSYAAAINKQPEHFVMKYSRVFVFNLWSVLFFPPLFFLNFFMKAGGKKKSWTEAAFLFPQCEQQLCPTSCSLHPSVDLVGLVGFSHQHQVSDFKDGKYHNPGVIFLKITFIHFGRTITECVR